jgi:hypothetical protein
MQLEHKLLASNVGFEMVVEGKDTIAVKRVYPDHLSEEEIAKAEKTSPKVTLHCFDPRLIEELYLIGEKISRQNYELYNAAMKRQSFFSTIKRLFEK